MKSIRPPSEYLSVILFVMCIVLGFAAVFYADWLHTEKQKSAALRALIVEAIDTVRICKACRQAKTGRMDSEYCDSCFRKAMSGEQ